MAPGPADGTIEIAAPAGWKDAWKEGGPETGVAPPDFHRSSEIAVDRWSAWGDPSGPGRLVVGCLGIDLRAWTDEATPIALERLSSTANETAASLTKGRGVRVAGETRTGFVAEQSLAAAEGDDSRRVGRTVLGFTTAGAHPRLTGCFAVCAPPSTACEGAIAAAHIGPAFVKPPPSTALLHALGVGLHHPRSVALAGVALFLVVGIVAVWTRPRPRTKVEAP